MKKLIFVLILGICLITPNISKAVGLEKFYLDVNTVVNDLNGLNTDINDLDSVQVGARLKASFIELGAGRIGIDIRPAYDVDSKFVNGTIGAYFRAGIFELYADHAVWIQMILIMVMME